MHGDPGVSRVRPWLAGAAALMLVAGVVGCSDGESGGPGPSGTTSGSSATPTPRPAPPLQEPTSDSATEFTRYFWELYNYAYATYDTGPIEAISEPGCRYCSSTVADVERIASAGTRIQGFRMNVLDAISPEQKVTTGTAVIAAVRQDDGVSQRADGSEKALSGFKNRRFTVALAWRDDHWSVYGIDFQADGP